jgi:hypothetical protein
MCSSSKTDFWRYQAMKIKSSFWKSLAVLLFSGVQALLTPKLQASPEPYSVTWYKISGGGGTSTNQPYAISGTIGQHDTGRPMSSGPFQVTGGYWAVYAVQVPGAPYLTITYTNHTAVVSWPQSVTGYTLQTNNNLATTNWQNWTGTVVNNSVTNSPASGNLYFRLVNP